MKRVVVTIDDWGVACGEEGCDWWRLCYAPGQCGFKILYGILNPSEHLPMVLSVWHYIRHNLAGIELGYKAWVELAFEQVGCKVECDDPGRFGGMLWRCPNLMLSAVVADPSGLDVPPLRDEALKNGFKPMGEPFLNTNTGRMVQWFAISDKDNQEKKS